MKKNKKQKKGREGELNLKPFFFGGFGLRGEEGKLSQLSLIIRRGLGGGGII